MASAASYPTDVKTLHFMLDEQRQLIESLKANLHRLLKWQFGPKSEHLNVDQLGLFVGGSVVIEVPASAPADHAERSNASPPKSERRRAVRVLRNLPRVIEDIDVPEAKKTCPCCGEALSPFGHESSEQLHYIPARLEVHEKRRQKYSCGHCHGSVVRAPVPALPPIPKSMASASLLAYLIVSKFADGLPLYRIAGRLRRIGIELSHTLMSEWLMQCYPLLEDLHRRMMRKVLDSGHIYTDDTTLPLQNNDAARRSTVEAKLWVYAKDHRHGPPADRVRVLQKPNTGCAPDSPGRLPRLCAGRRLSGLRSAICDRQDHRVRLQCARAAQVRGGCRSAREARPTARCADILSGAISH